MFATRIFLVFALLMAGEPALMAQEKEKQSEMASGKKAGKRAAGHRKLKMRLAKKKNRHSPKGKPDPLAMKKGAQASEMFPDHD